MARARTRTRARHRLTRLALVKTSQMLADLDADIYEKISGHASLIETGNAFTPDLSGDGILNV